MSNINKRLSELSPHVLSIRFTNGISVVDSFFNEGWTVPKSDNIGFETLPDKPTYYMLYPLNDKIGIDEMLDYVSYIIKVNIEREMKIKLLQEKINELKTIFTKSTLATCKTLKFSFSNIVQMEPDNGDIDLNDMPIIENKPEAKEDFSEETLTDVPLVEQPPMDDDVRRFNNQDSPRARVNNETFDLPPKKGDKIMVEEFDEPEVICKCDPNDPKQVCPVCIDY